MSRVHLVYSPESLLIRRYAICDVEERVGGRLYVAPAATIGGCEGNYRDPAQTSRRLNPPIRFQTIGEPPAERLHELSGGGLQLAGLEPVDVSRNVPDVSLLNGAVPCAEELEAIASIPPYAAIPADVFMHDVASGFYYRHDPRVWFQTNTPDKPATASNSPNITSPRVPKNHVNDGLCATTVTAGFGNTCGSPGEVANDPAKLNGYNVYLTHHKSGVGLYGPDGDPPDVPTFADPGVAANGRTQVFDWLNILRSGGHNRFGMAMRGSKNFVWTSCALNSKDQLRQRIAWAFAQLFVVSDELSGETEKYVAFYDIFVRHAFGNFRDMLQEVSYSPLMGDYLDFVDNRGLASGSFPDENYAREVMQLFTIGPIQLDADGEPMLDAHGQPLDMYTNDDILEFSRVWTGHYRQLHRSNIENWRSNIVHTPPNNLDPLRLQPMWRDPFPAVGLLGKGYLGDGYPLCSDLPARGFLRRGAVRSYIGPSVADCDDPPTCPLNGPQPTCCDPHGENKKDYIMLNHDGAYLTLDDPSSALHQRLCARAPADDPASVPCNLASQITLDATLACSGIECTASTVHVIKVVDGDTTAFYEWHRPACVEFPFYSDAKVITVRRRPMCANPQTEAAGSCCLTSPGNDATGQCVYPKERMTFAVNEARCAENSQSMCLDYTKAPPESDTATQQACGYNNRNLRTWTQQSCTIRARIDRQGWVNIVHDPFTHISLLGGKPPNFAADDPNPTYFRVLWEDGLFPTVPAGCASGCTIDMTGGTCLCELEVETTRVFDAIPATRAQVEAQATIGSPCPDAFDSGTYTLHGSNSEVAVHAFAADLSGGGFNARAIMKVIATGKCYSNRRSIVKIGAGTHGAGLFFFRNAPHFVSFTHAMARDAHHQSEAMIDHLFNQPNVPFFISRHLIKRFTSSNPSPRYVRAVAEAFRTGAYAGVNYGGGYGDLAATVSAVLLDEEARSTTLDADPSHGKLREPLLKVLDPNPNPSPSPNPSSLAP